MNKKQQRDCKLVATAFDARQKKVTKAFRLYKQVKQELDQTISNRRDHGFGILVGIDEKAKQWQAKRMRLEILEAIIEGRRCNWHHAPWLATEKATERNKS